MTPFKTTVFFAGRCLLISIAAYCAAPSAHSAQICSDGVQSLVPAARLTANSNGTLLNNESQLLWMRCLIGQRWQGAICSGEPETHDWHAAVTRVKQFNTSGGMAGKTDWRLPTPHELNSITDRRCTSPAVNLTLFPWQGVKGNIGVWSITTAAMSDQLAWFMNFDSGSDNTDWFHTKKHLLLVHD